MSIDVDKMEVALELARLRALGVTPKQAKELLRKKLRELGLSTKDLESK